MDKNLGLRTNMALGLTFAFLVNTFGPLPAYAQDFVLPAPGVRVSLSPEFNPPILKGIKVHPENPFRFDFILDRGDSQLSNDALKDESSKLIKYFLASLTIPEKDLWVNLSPYEKNRIVPESFGQTEMGRDLLAEDYMLKQITASLIYPEDEVGKRFWKRIYEEAAKKFGTTNIPVNTFNKVWIVPEKAVVYENAKAGTAYVVESKLKVMLEQDYLALSHSVIPDAPTVIPAKAGIQETSFLGSQIVREIVIPELTKEVNEDKNFSQLRQVYNSLILATWYKKKIKDSILTQVYENKNKVVGVNIDDPQEKEKIYERYLQAFKKGAYNYIKEEIDPITQETIPRKYFSGGMKLVFDADHAMTIIHHFNDSAMEGIKVLVESRFDAAMVGKTLTKSAYNAALRGLIGISWDAMPEDTKNVIKAVGLEKMIKMAKASEKKSRAWLFSNGFPALTKVMTFDEIQLHFDDLIKMVRASGDQAAGLFQWGLPAAQKALGIKRFRSSWGGLVRLVQGTGPYAVYVLMDFPILRDLLTQERFDTTVDDLIVMVKSAGSQADFLFMRGIPMLRRIFTPEEFKTNWPDLVEMVKATGDKSDILFRWGFAAVRRILTPETFHDIGWDLVKMSKVPGALHLFKDALPVLCKSLEPAVFKTIIDGLMEMAEAGPAGARDLFERGIPSLMRIFTPQELITYWPDLIEMAKASGNVAWHLFRYGLPAVRRVTTPEEFRTYWPGLVRTVRAAGKHSAYLFQYGFPAVRDILTMDTFDSISDGLVVMALAAGKNDRDLFTHGLYALRRLLTPEEFIRYWPDLVELARYSGNSTGHLFRYGVGAVRRNLPAGLGETYWKALVETAKTSGESTGYLWEYAWPDIMQDVTSVEDILKWGKNLSRVSRFIPSDQMGIYFEYFNKTRSARRLNDLSDDDFTSPYKVVSLLLVPHLEDKDKDDILRRFLEPYIFSHPSELTPLLLEKLTEFYKDSIEFRYFLYFVISGGASPQIKKQAEKFLDSMGFFPLHAAIEKNLRTGKKRALIIHNINDGLGDELVRIVTFTQALLDYNPDLEVTLITGRPFLYDHPRVRVIDRQLFKKGSDWAKNIPAARYDVIMNSASDNALDKGFKKSAMARKAFVYVELNKTTVDFILKSIWVQGRNYAQKLLLNRSRVDNVYETMFRLVAEMGMPLRFGENGARQKSLINGVPYPLAMKEWQKMMEEQVGNEFNAGEYRHKGILLNPFGGMFEDKGFSRSAHDQEELRYIMEDLVRDGYKVVILPNHQPWGTKEIADELVAEIPEQYRSNIVVGPEPKDDQRLFKYFVGYADEVLTVEGGMMHLAYNMGKPFTVLMKPGAGLPRWIPYGRTVRQIVIEEGKWEKFGRAMAGEPNKVDAAMTTEEILEKFRSHPQKESVGISGQDLNSSDIESVELAQQRLGGLVNDFIVANDGDRKVILQEKLLSLRDAVDQKLNQRDLSGVRNLLGQIFDLNSSMFKRGIIYQNFSYDSFAVRESGTVVITDMRGIKNFYSKEAIRNWDAYIKGMGASLLKGVPKKVSGILSAIGLSRGFLKHLPYTPHFVHPYLPIVLNVDGIKKRIRASIPNENTVRRNSKKIDTEVALRKIADKLIVQQEVQSDHQELETSSPSANGTIIIERDSDITKLDKRRHSWRGEPRARAEGIRRGNIPLDKGIEESALTEPKKPRPSGRGYFTVSHPVTGEELVVMVPNESNFIDWGNLNEGKALFKRVMKAINTFFSKRKNIERPTNLHGTSFIGIYNIPAGDHYIFVRYYKKEDDRAGILAIIAYLSQQRAHASGDTSHYRKDLTEYLRQFVAKAKNGNGDFNTGLFRAVYINTSDKAMSNEASKGGIDLTPANMNLQTKIDSRFRGNDSEGGGNDNGIKFHLDPAMLQQLQNAPGFVPVIINIQPLPDLRQFLEISENMQQENKLL